MSGLGIVDPEDKELHGAPLREERVEPLQAAAEGEGDRGIKAGDESLDGAKRVHGEDEVAY